MLYLYMRNQRAIVQTTPYPYANDITEVDGEAMKQSANKFLEGIDYQIKSWKMETIGNNTFLVLNYFYKLSLDYDAYFIIVDQQMYVFMGFIYNASGRKENQEFIYGMLETLAEAP